MLGCPQAQSYRDGFLFQNIQLCRFLARIAQWREHAIADKQGQVLKSYCWRLLSFTAEKKERPSEEH